MKINNTEDLQRYILTTLERLESKEIEVPEAGIIFKGCEAIASHIKLQLTYANMRNELPAVDFMHTGHSVEKNPLLQPPERPSLESLIQRENVEH